MKVVRHLVKLKLVACANVIDKVTSMYEWRGKFVEETESVALMKTVRTNSKKLVAQIKKIHSYECPCILELPITGGNDAFLDWVSNFLN